MISFFFDFTTRQRPIGQPTVRTMNTPGVGIAGPRGLQDRINPAPYHAQYITWAGHRSGNSARAYQECYGDDDDVDGNRQYLGGNIKGSTDLEEVRVCQPRLGIRTCEEFVRETPIQTGVGGCPFGWSKEVLSGLVHNGNMIPRWWPGRSREQLQRPVAKNGMSFPSSQANC